MITSNKPSPLNYTRNTRMDDLGTLKQVLSSSPGVRERADYEQDQLRDHLVFANSDWNRLWSLLNVT